MNKVLTVLIAAFGTVFAQDTQRSADSFLQRQVKCFT